MDDLGAEPVATAESYALVSTREVVVLLGLSDDDSATIAMLLADGASWSAQGLAEHAGVPVLVRRGNLLAAAFHPEIAGDPRLHRAVLESAG